MGYSCARKASDSYDAMLRLLQGKDPKGPQNVWSKNGHDYMVEIGRERADGAITGQVSKMLPVEGEDPSSAVRRCQRAGSIHITHEGVIVRWPSTTNTEREQANADGKAHRAAIEEAIRKEHGPGAILLNG